MDNAFETSRNLKETFAPAKYLRRGWGVLAATALMSITSTTLAHAETPVSGGTVIAGIGAADVPGLNTQMTSISDALLMAPVWADGLISYDRDGGRIPRLAESWSISDDGLVYTFKLRQGVKWSDGEDFTAEDVIFTIKKFAQYNTYLGRLDKLTQSVEAPDEHTVVLTLTQPLTATLDLLDKEVFPIMPAHVYGDEDVVSHPANRAPVGLGPFMFKTWNRGQSIEFVRNPNYWDTGKPYLDSVVFALIPNEQQRLNALKQGEIDWMQPSPAQYAEVEAAAKTGDFIFQKIKTNAPSRSTIDFNMRIAPTDNVLVRQALFQAIDRERIVRDVYRGFAKTAKNAIPVQFKNLHDPSIDYDDLFPYDPEAAGKLLDAAGFPMKDGKRLDIEFTYPTTNVLASIAKIVQANLEAIGVKVDLIGMETQLWIDKVYKKNDFQMSLIYLTGRTNPVLGIDRSFVCNENNVPFANPTGYCNAELDKIALEAAQASLDDQRSFYSKYAKIVAKDLNEITLTSAEQYEAYSKKFQNMETQFNFAYNSHPNWAEAWLPKNQQ